VSSLENRPFGIALGKACLGVKPFLIEGLCVSREPGSFRLVLCLEQTNVGRQLELHSARPAAVPANMDELYLRAVRPGKPPGMLEHCVSRVGEVK
jgi:hypothetical protein